MNSYIKLFLKKRWPLCCLLFFFTACRQQSTPTSSHIDNADSLILEQSAATAFQQIDSVKKLVHSGDIIFRTGRDFTSELMRRLSQKDKTYSHCGIAEWEKDTLFVYHALGGELNPGQRIRRDPFQLFCNPYENRGFGVFRYLINKQQQKNMGDVARMFYADNITFDMLFDLESDDKMYCSEFVCKTIERATGDSIKPGTTTLNHKKFIAVDNLFVNSFCRPIERVVFKTNAKNYSK